MSAWAFKHLEPELNSSSRKEGITDNFWRYNDWLNTAASLSIVCDWRMMRTTITSTVVDNFDALLSQENGPTDWSEPLPVLGATACPRRHHPPIPGPPHMTQRTYSRAPCTSHCRILASPTKQRGRSAQKETHTGYCNAAASTNSMATLLLCSTPPPTHLLPCRGSAYQDRGSPHGLL